MLPHQVQQLNNSTKISSDPNSMQNLTMLLKTLTSSLMVRNILDDKTYFLFNGEEYFRWDSLFFFLSTLYDFIDIYLALVVDDRHWAIASSHMDVNAFVILPLLVMPIGTLWNELEWRLNPWPQGEELYYQNLMNFGLSTLSWRRQSSGLASLVSAM